MIQQIKNIPIFIYLFLGICDMADTISSFNKLFIIFSLTFDLLTLSCFFSSCCFCCSIFSRRKLAYMLLFCRRCCNRLYLCSINSFSKLSFDWNKVYLMWLKHLRAIPTWIKTWWKSCTTKDKTTHCQQSTPQQS